MSSSTISLSTAHVPAPRRAQYWSQALTELCGDLHADCFGAETLDGHIDYSDLSTLRLCQIEVSRHRIALPRNRATPNAHPVIKILFQTFGRSILEQDGLRIGIESGDCLAYDVSRPHVITSESLTKHDVAIIPKALLRKRGIRLDGMAARKLSARTGAARLAHDFFAAAFKEASALSPSSELGIAESLLDVLLLPLRLDGVAMFDRWNPETLRWRTKTYIQDHLRDPELSIDRIAVALGCSKRYLHMLFAEDNTTISRYIWRSRLEQCRREFLHHGSTKAVTEIAFAWGFSSSSHFSRLFKEQFGSSPSVLRARARTRS